MTDQPETPRKQPVMIRLQSLWRELDPFLATGTAQSFQPGPRRRPARVGVAVHSGQALVGTTGAPERREYTVIGDTVSVVARLEEWNKRPGSCLIASAAVLDGAPEPQAAADLEGPILVELRGHGSQVPIYYQPEIP